MTLTARGLENEEKGRSAIIIHNFRFYLNTRQNFLLPRSFYPQTQNRVMFFPLFLWQYRKRCGTRQASQTGRDKTGFSDGTGQDRLFKRDGTRQAFQTGRDKTGFQPGQDKTGFSDGTGRDETRPLSRGTNFTIIKISLKVAVTYKSYFLFFVFTPLLFLLSQQIYMLAFFILQ